MINFFFVMEGEEGGVYSIPWRFD